MLGLFERTGASWNENEIPEDFSFGEINPSYDRMMPYPEAKMEGVPLSKNLGAKAFFCRPKFAPDGSPIVGESAEVRNYFVAAALNSIGMLNGGGIGELLARWMWDGCAQSDADVTAGRVGSRTGRSSTGRVRRTPRRST